MINIGFDIGGTYIKAGILDENNNVLTDCYKPFPLEEKSKGVIMLMDQMIKEMLNSIDKSIESVRTIGVGVPGSLDLKKEIVIDAYNLGFHNFN